MSFNPTRQTVYPETCAFPVKTCPRGGLTRRCEKVFCKKKKENMYSFETLSLPRNITELFHLAQREQDNACTFLPHAEKRT